MFTEVNGYSCSYVFSGRFDQVGYHSRGWWERGDVWLGWLGGFWFGQELRGGALHVVENNTCTAAGRGGGSGPCTLAKLSIGFGGVLFRNTIDVGSGKDCNCWFWLTVLSDGKLC